jgi:hypothetical protein
MAEDLLGAFERYASLVHQRPGYMAQVMEPERRETRTA